MPQFTPRPGQIHVCLTFDDNFWAPAYALMRSACLFTKRRADLVFHLLHRPLAPEHRADLDRIVDEFEATLVYYDLDRAPVFADIAARMPYNKRLTNIVYARLVIDRILPDQIERVLYLDCDMLIKAPLETLFERDLNGHPIAAAPEPFAVRITGGRDLIRNRDIFDPADPYFNAGLILIDLRQWREADILGRLEAALADGTMARIYYDQDFLNLVFKNQWLVLERAWNVIDARHAHEPLDCRILHYTGERKPWHLISGTAFAKLYRHVMTNELYYRFMRHRWRVYWRKKFNRLLGRKPA